MTITKSLDNMALYKNYTIHTSRITCTMNKKSICLNYRNFVFNENCCVRGIPKRRSAVKGRGLTSADIFRTKRRGSSEMDVHIFGAKNIEYFEIYGVSAWTRGVEPVQTFCGQEGQCFYNFVWTSFTDGSLRYCGD